MFKKILICTRGPQVPKSHLIFPLELEKLVITNTVSGDTPGTVWAADDLNNFRVLTPHKALSARTALSSNYTRIPKAWK